VGKKGKREKRILSEGEVRKGEGSETERDVYKWGKVSWGEGKSEGGKKLEVPGNTLLN